MTTASLSAAASTIYRHPISATRTVYATGGRLYASYVLGDAWAALTVEKTDTGLDVMVSTPALTTVSAAFAKESLMLAQEVTHLAEIVGMIGGSSTSGTRQRAVA